MAKNSPLPQSGWRMVNAKGPAVGGAFVFVELNRFSELGGGAVSG
jgi:hypothetical protein